MSDLLDRFIVNMRGPEVGAMAAGYIAGDVGYELLTPAPQQNEVDLHAAEAALVSMASAVAATGLVMVVRKIRDRANR